MGFFEQKINKLEAISWKLARKLSKVGFNKNFADCRKCYLKKVLLWFSILNLNLPCFVFELKILFPLYSNNIGKKCQRSPLITTEDNKV